MAEIMIKPVKITTVGGLKGEITGIDPLDQDCLIGNVPVSPYSSDTSWDLYGVCRDNSEKLNLPINEPCVRDVIETVKALQHSIGKI